MAMERRLSKCDGIIARPPISHSLATKRTTSTAEAVRLSTTRQFLHEDETPPSCSAKTRLLIDPARLLSQPRLRTDNESTDPAQESFPLGPGRKASLLEALGSIRSREAL